MSGKQSPGSARQARNSWGLSWAKLAHFIYGTSRFIHVYTHRGYFLSALVEDINYFYINDSSNRAGWKRSRCCQKAERGTRLITALDMTPNRTHTQRVDSLNHTAGTRAIPMNVSAFEQNIRCYIRVSYARSKSSQQIFYTFQSRGLFRLSRISIHSLRSEHAVK